MRAQGAYLEYAVLVPQHSASQVVRTALERPQIEYDPPITA